MTNGNDPQDRETVDPELETFTTEIRADGSRAVDGGRDLKGTQAYPPAFGEALVKLHADNAAEIASEFDAFQRELSRARAEGSTGPARKSWPRAGLRSALRALGRA